MPQILIPETPLDSIATIIENSKTSEILTNIGSVFEAIQNSNTLHTIGELVAKATFPTYQFKSPMLKAFEEWNISTATKLSNGLTAIINNPIINRIDEITSNIGKWLQEIDFSPLTTILENINSFGFELKYEDFNEVYLKTMFDAKWFPYVDVISDFRVLGEVIDILETSRVSNNRIKRIDRLIFSYYNKEELSNIKRRWRQKELPSYMTRILIQSIQAYNRREYALTLSALTTLWDGIIHEKVNDKTYRISRKTRENLSKLIEKNEFDKIYSSFCNEFIFYDCNRPEDVKPDVPGRHGIVHSWYNAYPNRKMALNAILFTDFLIRLEPLEKEEVKNNGQP